MITTVLTKGGVGLDSTETNNWLVFAFKVGQGK